MCTFPSLCVAPQFSLIVLPINTRLVQHIWTLIHRHIWETMVPMLTQLPRLRWHSRMSSRCRLYFHRHPASPQTNDLTRCHHWQMAIIIIHTIHMRWRRRNRNRQALDWRATALIILATILKCLQARKAHWSIVFWQPHGPTKTINMELSITRHIGELLSLSIHTIGFNYSLA